MRASPQHSEVFVSGLPKPVVKIDLIAEFMGISQKKASEYAANGTLQGLGLVPFKVGSKRSPWLVRTEEVAQWLAENWQAAGGNTE